MDEAFGTGIGVGCVMPKVNGKKYPYTKAGKAAAKKSKMSKGRKK